MILNKVSQKNAKRYKELRSSYDTERIKYYNMTGNDLYSKIIKLLGDAAKQLLGLIKLSGKKIASNMIKK